MILTVWVVVGDIFNDGSVEEKSLLVKSSLEAIRVSGPVASVSYTHLTLPTILLV